MITNDTIWAERQTPQSVTGDATTVTLQDGISIYQLNVGAVDTEITFSTSQINAALLAGDYNVIQFELIVVMGPTVQTLEFPESVAWLDSLPPTMNAPNKTYILLFRSYDGGQTWIGTAEGSF